ncbi:MAG: DUF1659 domain-containing protein [Megasphaera sp.]|jgi:hypothetical protein|nr:DUF1659 domain-containing protein [Megasphaera sp.]
MATRTAVSSKLKLTVSYTDDGGNDKTRQVTLANLKANVEAANIINAADAIATLQNDPVSKIVEVTENEISA